MRYGAGCVDRRRSWAGTSPELEPLLIGRLAAPDRPATEHTTGTRGAVLGQVQPGGIERWLVAFDRTTEHVGDQTGSLRHQLRFASLGEVRSLRGDRQLLLVGIPRREGAQQRCRSSGSTASSRSSTRGSRTSISTRPTAASRIRPQPHGTRRVSRDLHVRRARQTPSTSC